MLRHTNVVGEHFTFKPPHSDPALQRLRTILWCKLPILTVKVHTVFNTPNTVPKSSVYPETQGNSLIMSLYTLKTSYGFLPISHECSITKERDRDIAKIDATKARPNPVMSCSSMSGIWGSWWNHLLLSYLQYTWLLGLDLFVTSFFSGSSMALASVASWGLWYNLVFTFKIPRKSLLGLLVKTSPLLYVACPFSLWSHEARCHKPFNLVTSNF